MKKRKREEWEKLVKEQEQSGKSVSAWCRARGISESTYSYWRQQYGSGKAGSEFVRIYGAEPLVITSGGYRVEVSGGFDGEALKRVLGVIKDAAL